MPLGITVERGKAVRVNRAAANLPMESGYIYNVRLSSLRAALAARIEAIDQLLAQGVPPNATARLSTTSGSIGSIDVDWRDNLD